VPDENLIGILLPNPVEHALTGERRFCALFPTPSHTALGEIVHPGEKIAIDTSASRAHAASNKVCLLC
jgi:hypothetical protein